MGAESPRGQRAGGQGAAAAGARRKVGRRPGQACPRDIQDHSEAGGTSGPNPPDRYRLRLWFLKGADPSSADAISLRTAVGCTATPDIDDGGT